MNAQISAVNIDIDAELDIVVPQNFHPENHLYKQECNHVNPFFLTFKIINET